MWVSTRRILSEGTSAPVMINLDLVRYFHKSPNRGQSVVVFSYDSQSEMNDFITIEMEYDDLKAMVIRNQEGY